ncbi:hypothetical protein QJQ45_009104 [Haematococcus lacustris]|nr:hypothetical protein QJQ45_009104 [Haematococcus lacustris]
MDRFVVRGISADDAAENLLRQLDQHDEMLHQRALDCQDAAVEKRGPGRPRKLSSIGLLLARDPAASPSTPPPPSRSGRSHENWWHMMVPIEDSPLLTEQVVGMDVQSMTAVELMVAAQQWSAITRAMPAAMPAAKPSAKPAAATADGPPMRKRGRPLGSKNKPKPASTAQATPTPTRKQARLVCDTSSSANSSNANTSSDSNSSGDNSSNDDGSANNEGWVVGPTKSAVGVVGRAGAAAGVAGCTRSAARVAGEAGAAAREAGCTKSATGVLALAKAAAWVTARARRFECSEEDAEICRHCKQPQEHHDFVGEVQCPVL